MSKKIVALLICLLAVVGVSAQAIKDIRINELLVKNVNSYQDDYGHRVGWIELFNSGYSQVDVGGSYLSVKRGDKTKTYRIPKNDKRTIMAPQSYLIFFAEGTSSKGTFHTNFTLDETGYLAFFDASGRGQAIDSVMYNVNQMQEDVSIGWYEDQHSDEMMFGALKETTPLSTNSTFEKKPRSERFREADAIGIGMTVTAMSVVFLALIVLYLVFKQLGKTLVGVAKKKEKTAANAAAKPAETSKKPTTVAGDIAGEELAAIAVALFKYSEDLHDIENTVLTINRVAKAYSPWSSKIYGLRQTLNKK